MKKILIIILFIITIFFITLDAQAEEYIQYDKTVKRVNFNDDGYDFGESPLVWGESCKGKKYENREIEERESFEYKNVDASGFKVEINDSWYPAFCVDPDKHAPETQFGFYYKDFENPSLESELEKSYISIIQKAIEIYDTDFLGLADVPSRNIFEVVTTALRIKAAQAGLYSGDLEYGKCYNRTINVPTNEIIFNENSIGDIKGIVVNTNHGENIEKIGKTNLENIKALLKAKLWEPSVTLEKKNIEIGEDGKTKLTLVLTTNIGVKDDGVVSSSFIKNISLTGYDLINEKENYINGDELIFEIDSSKLSELCNNGTLNAKIELNYKDPRDIKNIRKMSTNNNKTYQQLIGFDVITYENDQNGTDFSIDDLNIECTDCGSLIEEYESDPNKPIGSDLLSCCDDIPMLIQNGNPLEEGIQEQYLTTCLENDYLCYRPTDLDKVNGFSIKQCIGDYLLGTKGEVITNIEEATTKCESETEECQYDCKTAPGETPEEILAWKTECCTDEKIEEIPDNELICQETDGCDALPSEDASADEIVAWKGECCPEEDETEAENWDYCYGEEQNECGALPSEDASEDFINTWKTECCPEEGETGAENWDYCYNTEKNECDEIPSDYAPLDEVTEWKNKCCEEKSLGNPDIQKYCEKEFNSCNTIIDSPACTIDASAGIGYIYEGGAKSSQNDDVDYNKCIINGTNDYTDEKNYEVIIAGLTGKYCKVYCKEDIDFEYPGYGYNPNNTSTEDDYYAIAGQYFVLSPFKRNNNYFLSITEQRTCIEHVDSNSFANELYGDSDNDYQIEDKNGGKKLALIQAHGKLELEKALENASYEETQEICAYEYSCPSGYNFNGQYCQKYIDNTADTCNAACQENGIIINENQCVCTTSASSSPIYYQQKTASYVEKENNVPYSGKFKQCNVNRNDILIRPNIEVERKQDGILYDSNINMISVARYQNLYDSALNDFTTEVTEFQKCTTWDNNYESDPEFVEFNYKEQKFNDLIKIANINLNNDGNFSQDKSTFYCDSSFNNCNEEPKPQIVEIPYQTETITLETTKNVKKITFLIGLYAEEEVFYSIKPSGEVITESDLNKDATLVNKSNLLGKVFPIDLFTRAGLFDYEFSIKNIGYNGRLDDLYRQEMSASPTENTYVCKYSVKNVIVCPSKTECHTDINCALNSDDPQCAVNPPVCAEGDINCENSLVRYNYEYRSVALNDLFPRKRAIGYNWATEKSQKIITEIQNNTETYKNENLLFEVTLNTQDIKKIIEYNANTSYDDFNLSCDKDNGLNCKSEFLEQFDTDGLLEKSRENWNYCEYSDSIYCDKTAINIE